MKKEPEPVLPAGVAGMPFDSETVAKAAVLWNYFASFASVAPADAIVVCCSYDLRVCDYACELWRKGIAGKIVFSGNTGNWTKHIWNRPEAFVFKERALAAGVPESAIFTETASTNFGENIAFCRQLLPAAKTAVFVTKPASVLRVLLTAKVQWPEIAAHVCAPAIRFPAEVSNVVGILGVIDEMVGDARRIVDYPKLGFQAEHVLPPEISEVCAYLTQKGFTHHLPAKT